MALATWIGRRKAGVSLLTKLRSDFRQSVNVNRSRTEFPAVVADLQQVADFTDQLPSLFHANSELGPIRLGYSTVTDFARLRGWSTSVPFATATWYASSCTGTA